MKFYITSLSVYSVLATVMVIALGIQNQSLKQGPTGQNIDWDTHHEVEIGNAPIKGDQDAAVTIVAFSDFECGYCAKGARELERLEAAFPGQIKIAFKHLPLPFHDNALDAAKAGLAAHVQGRFWDMQRFLFENQAELGPELYTKAVEHLNLDPTRFQSDMADGAWDTWLAEDMAQADRLGVQATPTYFVNGVKITGGNFQTMKKAVERGLAAHAKGPDA